MDITIVKIKLNCYGRFTTSFNFMRFCNGDLIDDPHRISFSARHPLWYMCNDDPSSLVTRPPFKIKCIFRCHHQSTLCQQNVHYPIKTISIYMMGNGIGPASLTWKRNRGVGRSLSTPEYNMYISPSTICTNEI